MPRKNPAVQSESAAWKYVRAEMAAGIAMLRGSSGRIDAGKLALMLEDVSDKAGEMLDQVADGFHENPGLIIWPNPPGAAVEQLSGQACEIAYIHEHDGKPYKHKFGKGVDIHLVSKGRKQYAVLSRHDGRALFQDF
jgi:hypothetical protein